MKGWKYSNWRNLLRPVTFAECLDFTTTRRYDSYWLLSYTDQRETVPDCITRLAHNLVTLLFDIQKRNIPFDSDKRSLFDRLRFLVSIVTSAVSCVSCRPSTLPLARLWTCHGNHTTLNFDFQSVRITMIPILFSIPQLIRLLVSASLSWSLWDLSPWPHFWTTSHHLFFFHTWHAVSIDEPSKFNEPVLAGLTNQLGWVFGVHIEQWLYYSNSRTWQTKATSLLYWEWVG